MEAARSRAASIAPATPSASDTPMEEPPRAGFTTTAPSAGDKSHEEKKAWMSGWPPPDKRDPCGLEESLQFPILPKGSMQGWKHELRPRGLDVRREFLERHALVAAGVSVPDSAPG